MKIAKGSIIHVDGWWFVVVEHRDKYIRCICDNANNTYSWLVEDCKLIATPLEAMRTYSFGRCPIRIHDAEFSDKLLTLHYDRQIPAEVIAEVLAGCHDDRFDHCRD